MEHRARVVCAVSGGGPSVEPILAAIVAAGVAPRFVAATELLGRDLRECRRFCVVGLQAFGMAPQLRELFAQTRDRCVALLDGEAATSAAADAEQLALLRRNVGRVAVLAAPAAAELLRARLLAPVDAVAAAPAALAAVFALPTGPTDAVEVRLREAEAFLARGDQRAAFGAVARALQQAPDQPGIVAAAIRLLANLGEVAAARTLAARFLQQRGDAAPVLAALAELDVALPQGAALARSIGGAASSLPR